MLWICSFTALEIKGGNKCRFHPRPVFGSRTNQHLLFQQFQILTLSQVELASFATVLKRAL